MIKAIIFDFDGVIHDTLKIAHEVNNKINTPLTLEGYKELFEGNLYKKLKTNKEMQEKFFELQSKAFATLKIEENIRSELLKLKKKYDLFIVTSNQEKTLKAYFENNNLHTLFKQILGFESHTSKEEKFKMLLEKHKLSKDNCLFVTDTLGDILEAKKMGIRTIAVDFGFHDRARLEKGNPAKIVSKFEDILPAIEELSK